MPARQIVIFGKVQGVGFRSFVSCVAAVHGVGGEVWNRRDGAVEAIVELPSDELLDRFQAELYKGPGRVERISSAAASERGFTSFEVGPTR